MGLGEMRLGEMLPNHKNLRRTCVHVGCLYIAGVYRVNGQDEATFTDEMILRYDDFHRTYAPYHRLIGAAAMRRYLSTAASGTMQC